MFVSVILPVRNEATTIRQVLSAVLQQDYPRELIEAIVADGMSVDGTREIVGSLAAKDSRLRMVDNPKQITPAGLNLAIREARGEVIVRVDGHGVIPPNYVRECVAVLSSEVYGEGSVVCSRLSVVRKPQPVVCGETRSSDGRKAAVSEPSFRAAGKNSEIGNLKAASGNPESSRAGSFLAVGGAWDSVGRGRLGEAIAIAMSSKLGVGNSPYRVVQSIKTPILTDTVPFWATRKQTFARLGLFREEMLCHEDYEFNHRVRSAGGAILLLPWLRSRYYVRSTLTAKGAH